MKNPAPSVELSPEPIYEYVKGEGWVAKAPGRAYTFDEMNTYKMSFDLKCENCNRRLGSHSVDWSTGGMLRCVGGRAGQFSPIW